MNTETTLTGIIVGTFSPLHSQDLQVIEFAKHFADELLIVVLDTNVEPLLPLHNRMEWLRTAVPGCRLQPLTLRSESTGNISDVAILLKSLLPEIPDFVFDSNPDRGRSLASALGARYIVCDVCKDTDAVEKNINNHPSANWHLIPRQVRPHFVKRVCIFGPESTGKTTLTNNLARHFNTVCAVEWARIMLGELNNELAESDLKLFARGQIALEDSLASDANRVLFCDSDALTTSIWSNWLYGRCEPSILKLADSRNYDLYLLTHVDVPWVADPQRYLPEKRTEFFQHCLEELEKRERKIVHIKGDWDTRFNTAVKAVEELLWSKECSNRAT